MKQNTIILLLSLLISVSVSGKKPKWAYNVWFLMEHQSNLEKQPNENVSFSYEVYTKDINGDNYYYSISEKRKYYPQPFMVVTIQNNNSFPIYVDLSNSFMVANQETYPLYTNTTNVSSKGSTSMTGVNFGLVGIGSSVSDIKTTITQETRYIMILGETKKSFEFPLITKWNATWKLNGVNGELKTVPGTYRSEPAYFAIINNNFINQKEVLKYEDAQNPFTLDIRICYSFNDSMEPSFVNKSVYYTKYIIGTDGIMTISSQTEAQHNAVMKVFPDFDLYKNRPEYLGFNIWCKLY